MILNNDNMNRINSEKRYKDYEGFELFIKLLLDRFYHNGIYYNIKGDHKIIRAR